MSLPSDTFFDATFRVDGLGAPLKMLDYGHGQSVLSKTQYQVLLAFRTFGPGDTIGTAGRELAYPSTVEDIAPTILDYLKVPATPLAASGQSLLPVMIGTTSAGPEQMERIRFTETDLSVLPAPGGGVDEVATAQQNAMFFMVDPDSARLNINPAFAPLAKAFKERAAFTRDQLLAAMPASPYTHQYLFFDFARHQGRLLLERPAEDGSVEQRLWDALASQYPGELHDPVRITPADWPRLSEEWTAYATALKQGQPPPTTPEDTKAAAAAVQ
jgi:hypothetical protein